MQHAGRPNLEGGCVIRWRCGFADMLLGSPGFLGSLGWSALPCLPLLGPLLSILPLLSSVRQAGPVFINQTQTRLD